MARPKDSPIDTGSHGTLINRMAAAMAGACGVEYDGISSVSKTHWTGMARVAIEAARAGSANLKNDEARESIPRMCSFILNGG